MAFNPITLEYHDTRKGKELNNKDDAAKFRHKLRSKNIDMRANSAYNILTGEERTGVDLPKEALQKYASNI